MTDLILYRLNRVPDKNYVKFLELIGIRLEPARAATVDLTFRLSAAQPVDVVIPRGTAVGSGNARSPPPAAREAFAVPRPGPGPRPASAPSPGNTLAEY